MRFESIIFFATLFLIAYCLLLYPALCAAIGGSRLRPNNPKTTDLPRISVLVAAYNEDTVIADKIQNFLSLDYPKEKIEMLIVDDASSDATRSIIESHLSNNIRLLPLQSRAGKAAAINRLTDAASHDLLLLCDANVMFDSQAAKTLAAHFSDPLIGAVTGRVSLVGASEEIRAGESLYYIIEQRIQEAEGRVGSLIGVDGGMYMLRKDLYQPLPESTILDDFAISMGVIRSEHKIIYDRHAFATESGTPSYKQEFNRRIRMMSGIIQILRMGLWPKWTQPIIWIQFISHKALRWALPILLAGLFSSSWLLRENHLLHSAVFICISLSLIISAFAFFIPRFRTTKIGSVTFYFYLSQIASVIGFLRGLTQRQKGYWEKGKRSS